MLLSKPDQHRDVAFLCLLVLPTAKAHPHLIVSLVYLGSASTTNRRLCNSADRRDLGMSASDSRERLHETQIDFDARSTEWQGRPSFL
jgi:hypothetical protein